MPEPLSSHADARAFWAVLRELPVPPELLVDLALDLDGIITKRKVRDWTRNVDVQNQMRNDIEDYLYDLRARGRLRLSTADLDRVLEAILELARQRERIA